MSTLNGIGTRFNGVSQPDEHGNAHATCWFTFLYISALVGNLPSRRGSAFSANHALLCGDKINNYYKQN